MLLQYTLTDMLQIFLAIHVQNHPAGRPVGLLVLLAQLLRERLL